MDSTQSLPDQTLRTFALIAHNSARRERLTRLATTCDRCKTRDAASDAVLSVADEIESEWGQLLASINAFKYPRIHKLIFDLQIEAMALILPQPGRSHVAAIQILDLMLAEIHEESMELLRTRTQLSDRELRNLGSEVARNGPTGDATYLRPHLHLQVRKTLTGRALAVFGALNERLGEAVSEPEILKAVWADAETNRAVLIRPLWEIRRAIEGCYVLESPRKKKGQPATHLLRFAIGQSPKRDCENFDT